MKDIIFERDKFKSSKGVHLSLVGDQCFDDFRNLKFDRLVSRSSLLLANELHSINITFIDFDSSTFTAAKQIGDECQRRRYLCSIRGS